MAGGDDKKEKKPVPVEESGSSRTISITSIEKLAENNYGRWAKKLKISLSRAGCWDQTQQEMPDPISTEQKAVWEKKELEAQEILINTLTMHAENIVCNCQTAKQIWDKLNQAYCDSNEINMQRLLTNFHTFSVKDDQTCAQAFAAMEVLTHEMKEAGIEQPEKSTVMKLVSALPQRYDIFKRSWMSVMPENQTMVYLLSRMRSEDRLQEMEKARTPSAPVTAYVAQAQKSGGRRKMTKEEREKLKKTTKCHFCKKKGHWQRECTLKKKQSGEKKKTDDEDDDDKGKPKEGGGESSKAGFKSKGTSNHGAFVMTMAAGSAIDELQVHLVINDSASTGHVVNSPAWFVETEELPVPIVVRGVGKGTVETRIRGKVMSERFVNGRWEPYLWPGLAYLVPECPHNLFSEGYMEELGYRFLHDGNKRTYVHQNTGEIGPSGVCNNRLYELNLRIPKNEMAVNVAETSKNELKVWHKRCAHIYPKYICQTFTKGAAKGPKDVKRLQGKVCCWGCAKNKITRPRFPRNPKRATEPGQLVHADLSGKKRISSLGGAQYFLLCKDDATAFAAVYFLKKKSDAAAMVKQFCNRLANQTGKSIKAIKTDGGTEFLELIPWMSEKGIVHQKTIRHCPESNGRIEREMRTQLESTKTMMNDAKLPTFLWAEVMATSMFFHNRMLNSIATKKTPYEAVFGEIPDLRHVLTVGTKVVFYPHELPKDQWEERGRSGRIVGFQDGGFYRVYDPANRSVVVTNSIRVMNEETGSCKFNSNEKTGEDDRVVVRLDDEDFGVISEEEVTDDDSDDESESSEETLFLDDFFLEEEEEQPDDERVSEEEEDDAGVEPPNAEHDAETEQDDDFVLEISADNDNLFESSIIESQQETEPVRETVVPRRPEPKPLTKTTTTGAADTSVSAGSSRGSNASIASKTSKTSNSSRTSTSRQVVIDDGKKQYRVTVEPNQTTKVVLPSSKKSPEKDDKRELRNRELLRPIDRLGTYIATSEIKIPQTYNEALKSEEVNEWYEAMAAEWNSLIENETFELVDRPSEGVKVLKNRWVFSVKESSDGEIVRFKARIVAKGYEIDFDETFSPVVRYESIRTLLAIAAGLGWHMRQFDITTAFLNAPLDEDVYMEQIEGFEKRKHKKVMKLKKALYGLSNAPRAWNKQFKKTMAKIGLYPLEADNCIYAGTQFGEDVYVSLYVDDGLVLSSNLKAIEFVLSHLKENFKIKSAKASQYVGMEITRGDRGEIHISQAAHIKKLLDRFNMNDCKLLSTPMDHCVKLKTATEADPKLPYRQLVGALLFIARVTRPDICFAVSKLSQFMHAYDESHFKSAKGVLRYLKGTMQLGITYVPAESVDLVGFTDADWSGDRNDARSTTGVVFMVNGAPVLWTSKKQRTVALSSCESEYVALSRGGQDAKWMIKLLSQLRLEPRQPIPMFIDNCAAKALAYNPVHHERTKHFDVKVHFIRELVRRNTVAVEHISGSSNPADCLTKALPKGLHEEAREMLSIDQKPDSNRKCDQKREKKLALLGKRVGPNMMGITPKVLLLSTVILNILACVSGNKHLFSTGPVVAWRKSNIPIVHGSADIEMDIHILSPCELLRRENITKEVWVAAEEWIQLTKDCDALYQTLYVAELQDMGKPSGGQQMGIKVKRELITCFIIVTSVVVAAASTAAVTISVINTNEIGAQGNRLDNLEQDAVNLRQMQEVLKKYERELAIDMDKLKVDLKGVKANFSALQTTVPGISMVLGLMSAKLTSTNVILKEAKMKWRQGKLHQPLFDMFNKELPCNGTCPLEFGEPKSCVYMADKQILVLRIRLPLITEKMSLLEADAFEIFEEGRDKICQYSYDGPKFLVYSTVKDCVVQKSPIVPTGHLPVILATDECKEMEKGNGTMKYFRKSQCYMKDEFNPDSWVQIKVLENGLLVYCPRGNITVEGETTECPNHVVSLDRKTAFKVDGNTYSYESLKIGGSTVSDPGITFKANWFLKPSAAEPSIADRMDKDLKEVGDHHTRIYGGSNNHGLSVLSAIGWTCLVLLGIGFIVYCKKSKKKVEQYRSINIKLDEKPIIVAKAEEQEEETTT